MATETKRGAQRLDIPTLKKWEALKYGMFIHFGMSTFDGVELSRGDKPSNYYAPPKVNVDQWIQVARDSGMTYAILTAKHVAGHALWPTKHSDYHVGTSGNKTDVVEAFVKACEKHGILPGIYYCSWDNHHLFGSLTPTHTEFWSAFTTPQYREFHFAQMEELLTQYGKWAEVWIDIPSLLRHDGRREQLAQILRHQPDTIVLMNNGISDGSVYNYNNTFPSDLMTIERFLPNSARGYNPWHTIEERLGEPKQYYVPAEVSDPIGYEWFYQDNDPPRSDAELLGMRLISEARGANLLLDVPPSRAGIIEKSHVDALSRLSKNYDKIMG